MEQVGLRVGYKKKGEETENMVLIGHPKEVNSVKYGNEHQAHSLSKNMSKLM
jgi:hypothetical protein